MLNIECTNCQALDNCEFCENCETSEFCINSKNLILCKHCYDCDGLVGKVGYIKNKKAKKNEILAYLSQYNFYQTRENLGC